jgi:trehalose 6-phosphate phosphatase
MRETEPPIVNSLPRLAANAAFFIDFDGTLVEIASRPDLVEIDPRVRHVLDGLIARYDGAVAIVTGRPLDAVDAFLAPLHLPVAAEHGAVRRDAAGAVHQDKSGAQAAIAAWAELAPFAEATPGLVLERKQAGVALHYRQRPELEEACAIAIGEAASRIAGLKILPGKMVYELKPAGVTKGTAVAAFLEEPPFTGRVPVYAGDDLTDEYAFDAVNAVGGVSIKIGEGETAAHHRTTREGFLRWAEGRAKEG